MPVPPRDKLPHLLLRDTSTSKPFTAHSSNGGSKPALPELPRQQHGQALQRQLATLKPLATSAAAYQRQQEVESGIGLQIQFVSQPNVELAFQSLAEERGKDDSKKIELLSVRQDGEYTYANVFVPDGKLAHFEKYVTEYLEEKKDRNGNARDHKPLLNTIEAIRAAELRALWTDDATLLPVDPDEAFWWEVWLPVRGNRQAVLADFRKLAGLAECRVSDQEVHFPERTVVLMHASQRQFSGSVMTLNCVAELRRAKETAEFFDEMGVGEQREWQDELLQRVRFPSDSDAVPRICLLDSGVNRGHPLLSPLMAPGDMHTVDRTGLTDDTANHGTGMAGLSAYGDLTEAVASSALISIEHRLESVRLVAAGGANVGSATLHAQLFSDAVARPEITHAHRKRVFCSAVTASDYRDRGRPSSWSAMVDSLAADPDGAGQFPRLFILSAGNTDDPAAWAEYPASLSTNLVHDPGQAWNALTVGACTSKTNTQHRNYQAVAPEGGLSPYTTTSASWDRAWPLKPDIVLEGGNLGDDGFGPIGMNSLQLLSTNNRPQERLFRAFNATSAASALCAKIASEIAVAYPALRPETIRALIVHSAEWSDGMLAMYLPEGAANKASYAQLIRHCGWGEPNLERALWSANNSLTLVIEDELHPYKKEKGESVKSRDMNLHELPWPRAELEALQDAQVQMRVTLSYFIEPNPSTRGSASKYHYPSHRLRFDVQRPLDASTEDFVARINAAAQREDEGDPVNPADPNWYLGDRQRHRGSLHQDVWEGTAADLASRGFLAVYPAAGWWRTRPALERYSLPARYSLVVSIRTEQTEVDLYNAIANKVAVVV
ncbi:S8 family peptidase [Azoarcus taiwanensis]|uniref:S8 family serine peptidase n=1 Tax=Azoarcus taiwanensis TaxID=666964 RepID=A0A972J9C6_9RHOO|nr:S8 family peptidase [Azoarcus taiwanensis]NMG01853.1 S8 family serine peptidase [Azoarcus taiwanensis]